MQTDDPSKSKRLCLLTTLEALLTESLVCFTDGVVVVFAYSSTDGFICRLHVAVAPIDFIARLQAAVKNGCDQDPVWVYGL